MDIPRINGLSLFSGIGGIDKAIEEWVKTVCYCEIDTYCQGILLSNMSSGILRISPIWDDIRTFDGGTFKDSIDIIYGGFPCQDISIAGLGKGLEGKRSGLFFEIMRVSKEIKPKFIFLENVPAITTRGGLRVVQEIAEMGYDCRWCVISASSVGANNKRERWFLLAHLNGEGINGLPIGKKEAQPEPRMHIEHKEWNKWPANQSSLLGVDDVVPFRMDRARALGNAVCVEQAKEAFKILMGLT